MGNLVFAYISYIGIMYEAFTYGIYLQVGSLLVLYIFIVWRFFLYLQALDEFTELLRIELTAAEEEERRRRKAEKKDARKQKKMEKKAKKKAALAGMFYGGDYE